MKGAIAIIVVLSATALLVAAEATAPVKYDAAKYFKRILKSMQLVTSMATEIADEYMSLSNNLVTKDGLQAAGKLAVASELMSSVAVVRQVASLRAMTALAGNDYATEMKSVAEHQLLADSEISDKLDQLIKIADTLRFTTIYSDVKSVVNGIKEHRSYLRQLRENVPQ